METHSKIIGMNELNVAETIIKESGIEDKITVEEASNLVKQQWPLEAEKSGIKLLPGAEKLVRHLKAHQIPISISTGSSDEVFAFKEKFFQDFFDLFDFVVKERLFNQAQTEKSVSGNSVTSCLSRKTKIKCGSDPEVKNGKPAPDAYDVARRRFPNPPEPNKCLAFEDAPNGVESALAAGMQVVMVPSAETAPYVDTSKATLLLKTLEDFKPENFGLPKY